MTSELMMSSEISDRRLLNEVMDFCSESEYQLTQLKNMTKALDESSIVSIMDTEGNIKYVNDKFCEISKYSMTEILGKTFQVLRAEIHSPKFYEELWGIITSGNVWRGEICNKAKDGSYFWNKATIIPFVDKYGKIIEYVAIRTDITQQKQNERFWTVGELSARIAHDLRNPLSVIKNSTEILQCKMGDKASPYEQQEIARIQRAIIRMTNQIEGVLGYVRKNSVNLQKSSLLQLITNSTYVECVPDNIKINLPKNDFEVFVDPHQIEIVMGNLLRNAIEAISNKDGEINFNIYDQKDAIIIKISNTGPSIPDLELNSIFDLLFTTKHTGTGLGLVSCKSIIEKHGGTISVRNNPTTFMIILPKQTKKK